MADRSGGSYVWGAIPGTYSASNVNREDLLGLITNVDPTYTPFLTTCAKTTVRDAMAHYWFKDTLSALSVVGAKEGTDFSVSTTTRPTREYNWCWIGRKDILVTETQRAANPAAFADTYGYEQQKAGKEILRNLEALIFANDGAQYASGSYYSTVSAAATNTSSTANEQLKWTTATGTSAAARYPKNLESFLTSNVMYSTDLTGTTIGSSCCVAGILAVNDVNKMLQTIWTNGGEPDSIWVNGPGKRQMSAFTQGSQNRNILAEDKKLTLAIDVFDTDFGLKVVICSRWVPRSFNSASTTATGQDVSGRIFFLERRNVRLGTYRPLAHSFIGKLGDSVAGYMAGEWTLEVLNEKSCGVIKGYNDKSAVS